MEVNFAIGEKISPKSTPSTWEYPLSTSWDLNFSTCHIAFKFFLNTHFLPIGFLPLGFCTKSHVSFLCKDYISSTIASFKSLLYVDSTTSLIDLGFVLVVDNTNEKWKPSRLYLSTCFLTCLGLLKTKVGCSTSSSNLVNSSKSWKNNSYDACGINWSKFTKFHRHVKH